MVNDSHVCQCYVCPNLDCSRWAINRVNLYIIELVGCGIFGGDDQ